jgi:hypothetical protein
VNARREYQLGTRKAMRYQSYSKITPARKAQINMFEYFILLQQEKEAVKADPAQYLRWNYTANM